MFIVDRLFTYPVLCSETDDYVGSIFEVAYSVKRNNLNFIKIDFSIVMNDVVLARKIKNKEAIYMIHAECSNTAYRRNIKTNQKNISINIPIDQVRDKVDFIAMIVAEKNLERFENITWNEDYDGLQFDIKKASILAYQNIGILNIQKKLEDFSTGSSIFSVCSVPDEDNAIAKVALTQDKITIRLPKKQYLMYTIKMKNAATQPLANALIIFPVLIYILGELECESAEETYGQYLWYQTLEESFEHKSAILSEELYKKGSYELAQEIMNSPLFNAFMDIETIQEGV